MNAAPVPPMDDLAMLADMATQECGLVRWRCVYCQREVGHESSPCCGEIHSEVIFPEDEE